MLAQLDLFDLTELQLYRSRATENEYSHLDATLFVVNFFNSAGKIGKRTIIDAHRLHQARTASSASACRYHQRRDAELLLLPYR